MIQKIGEFLTASRIVGLDMGATTVRMAEVAQSDEGLVLCRAAIVDVDPKDLAQSLKRAMFENGFKTRRVALGLSSPELVVQAFQFPRMPKNEMINAIELEAEHAILNGHPLEKMAVDWHFLNDGSGDLKRGLLAVIPQEVLFDQIRIAKTAGLDPLIVDVKSLALWNTYWTLLGKKGPVSRTVLLIHLDVRMTHFVVVQGAETLILARDIQLGTASLQNDKDAWFSELNDSLVYARSQGGLRKIEAVYVTGADPNEILERIPSALGVPATLWNPLDHIPYKPDGAALACSQGPLLAVAIGLALRGSL